MSIFLRDFALKNRWYWAEENRHCRGWELKQCMQIRGNFSFLSIRFLYDLCFLSKPTSIYRGSRDSAQFSRHIEIDVRFAGGAPLLVVRQ